MKKKKTILKSDRCSLIMSRTRAFQIMLDVFIGSRYDKESLPGDKVGEGEEGLKKCYTDCF